MALRNIGRFTVVVLFILSTLTASVVIKPSESLQALEGKCRRDFVENNEIPLYDPCQPVCDISQAGILENGVAIDYAGNTVLSSTQIQAIKDNRVVYENAASKANIPWELLASVHYRETGLRAYGPTNGNGPYQIVGSSYPISDSYTLEEFQAASDVAATFIKSKSDNRDLSDLNNIKFTLFAYNGASSQYISQALALDLSQQEADSGDGSPYVMNQVDLIRDPRVEPTKTNGTWGQIVVDGGNIEYPANSGSGQYGAFVIYSLLVGVNTCDVGNAGINGDPGAVQEAFAAYMKSHDNKYATYILGENGCTTLSSWYIGEYTTLTYGKGHGKDVVGNLVATNPGLEISSTPVAPSLFSVAGGIKAWGGSGGASYGHVGLVVSVDEVTKTATTVATGSGSALNPKRSFINTYSYPNSAVTFVYLGDNLK